MAWQEPKTNWAAGNIPTASDFNRIEENIRVVGQYDRAPGYAEASGSTNAYSVTLNPAPSSYYDGMCIAIKINTNNTGASTINVNGLGAKYIKKANGNDVSSGNLKAGSIYTLRYNATTGNFILQGEGGGGTAQPEHVLQGKTFTNDEGEKVGTMPNNGDQSDVLTITGSSTPSTTIPAGYTPGGTITAEVDSAQAEVIKAGTILGGTTGTFTSDANANAGDILSGKTAYVNGSKVTGSMPNQRQYIITPGITNKAIPAGYHDGTGYVVGSPNLLPENIRDGVTIFDTVGTLKPIKGTYVLYHTGTEYVDFDLGYYSENNSYSYLSFTSSYIRIKVYDYDEYNAVTVNPINLSNYRLIKMVAKKRGTRATASAHYLAVVPSFSSQGSLASIIAEAPGTTSNIDWIDFTLYLDISDVYGDYHILCGCDGGASGYWNDMMVEEIIII